MVDSKSQLGGFVLGGMSASETASSIRIPDLRDALEDHEDIMIQASGNVFPI